MNGLVRAAVLAAVIGMPLSAQAALIGDRFICTVSPGWNGSGQTSMPLRIWLAPPRMHVILPMITGPAESYYTLLTSNEVGVVAADGQAIALPGIKATAGAWVISILRSTGVIRWTATGADSEPLEDRIGTCRVLATSTAMAVPTFSGSTRMARQPSG